MALTQYNVQLFGLSICLFKVFISSFFVFSDHSGQSVLRASCDWLLPSLDYAGLLLMSYDESSLRAVLCACIQSTKISPSQSPAGSVDSAQSREHGSNTTLEYESPSSSICTECVFLKVFKKWDDSSYEVPGHVRGEQLKSKYVGDQASQANYLMYYLLFLVQQHR
jgi:hypothetical protein